MGKLSIVLAFLLSVAAAGGSYYLYQGWVEARTIRGEVQAKYDQVKEKMITVQSEKEKIAIEKEKVAAKSETYRTQAEAMQTQLGKLQEEQKAMDAEKAELTEKVENDQKMIAELQEKMLELEQKAKEAQAACGVTPADLKTDPLAAARPVSSVSGTSQLVFKPVTPGGTSVSMQTSGGRSTDTTVAAPQEVSGAVSAPGVSSGTTSSSGVSSSTTAGVGGAMTPKVLTVNRKFNFVVINQGLQEGLKMGDKLFVLKQGQEVATVQIEKLYDKFSAASILAENPKQQVVEGDEIRKA